MRPASSMSLGLASWGDPEDRDTASGWPTSVLYALRDLVGEVHAVQDTPSGAGARAALVAGGLVGLRPSDLRRPRAAKDRLWTVGRSSMPYARARASSVAAGLRGAGALDGFVQNGGDYPAPAGLRMVTYQDSTVVQAAESYEWAHHQGLSRGQIAGLARRQRAAYRSAVACCTFSHWAAGSITSDYGIPAAKVHVVGLGTNDSFAELGSLQRDWSRPRFLFVGFDWVRKNGELVRQAFARVRERVPEATLDLVGGHPRIMDEGVSGHGVLAIGDPADRAQLTALFARATAFVMPSQHEPAGTVHIEAAAAGIPSIGTKNGGAATCIGEAGFLVDPGSPEELVEAMLALCDPATAARLGALGREHATQFTWPKVAERLVRALEPPGVELEGLEAYL